MYAASRALTLFCRYPYSGPVKTRLARSIGEQEARELYAAFLQDITQWANDSQSYDLLIALDDEYYFEAFSREYGIHIERIFSQGTGDLGARFVRSFEETFDRGYERAALAASDAPELTPEDVNTAFDSLDTFDVVFNPAPDGGWSLLALKELHDVFSGVTWSTSTVLSEMMELTKIRSWDVCLLDYVADVDDKESLDTFRERLVNSPDLRRRLPHTARQLLGR